MYNASVNSLIHMATSDKSLIYNSYTLWSNPGLSSVELIIIEMRWQFYRFAQQKKGESEWVHSLEKYLLTPYSPPFTSIMSAISAVLVLCGFPDR